MCVIYDLQQLYGFAIGEWSENMMEREGEKGIGRQKGGEEERQENNRVERQIILLYILAYLDRSQ